MTKHTLAAIVEPEPQRLTIEDVARIRHLTSQSFLLTNTQTTPSVSPTLSAQENNHRTELTTPRCPRNISAPPHLQQSACVGSPPENEPDSPTTRLRPARFTPIHYSTGSTTPSTASLVTNTKPYPTPRPLTPNMSSDNPRPIPLFHGDYREKEEPSLWFAQFQLSLPDSYLDAQCIQRLKMQLAPGTPRRIHRKEHVMAQVLKEEDIGVWLPGEPTGNYGHVTWATKVMRIPMGMSDSAGLLVEYAVEGIPNVLKDHLTCSYSSWQEFLQDVESVPAIKLKRAKEDLNMNRTCDADITQLKAQSSSTFNTLPFQFSQMTMDNSRQVQPSYRASRAYANANPFLSTTPNANLAAMPAQAIPVASVNRPTRGAGSNIMGWRGNMLTRPTLTRAQIMEKLNTLPQHQATEVGRQQYEADVEAWHHMHGTEGTPSLERWTGAAGYVPPNSDLVEWMISDCDNCLSGTFVLTKLS
ncbi:hypothetical protein EV424DRAFT_1535638 [Suillus variegatus]|nr:hypothetical protein EV424DRAFT_1535638 [Suillus variegatus]